MNLRDMTRTSQKSADVASGEITRELRAPAAAAGEFTGEVRAETASAGVLDALRRSPLVGSELHMEREQAVDRLVEL